MSIISVLDNLKIVWVCSRAAYGFAHAYVACTQFEEILMRSSVLLKVEFEALLLH